MLMNDWTLLDATTGLFRCKRCSATEEAPPGPMLLVQYADIWRGFAERHAHCEPGDDAVDGDT